MAFFSPFSSKPSYFPPLAPSGSDPDTRKMTGYTMSLNGGTISWRSSRQGVVTFSSSETEFVGVSQDG